MILSKTHTDQHQKRICVSVTVGLLHQKKVYSISIFHFPQLFPSAPPLSFIKKPEDVQQQ